MNNTTPTLTMLDREYLARNDHYGWNLELNNGETTHYIALMDEGDAERWIRGHVCLGSATGLTKRGEELVLSSNVVCADDLDEFFFRGCDWRVLKRYNLTNKALELVEEMREKQCG